MAIVSLLPLFGGIMENDSALYASISKTIALNNDWFNLYVRGNDWLDKPHLTFWLSALSFKIFGINAFAFKLPSYLFGLLGAFYTYKFGKLLYNEKIGLTSALIFLSSLHVIVSTFDVRAEIYICTFTLAAIYHYYRAHQASFWHIVLGSLFAACAIMIKGIFVLIPIFLGFVSYWIFTKQYHQLSKPKWYLAIVLVLLFITPELYSLYVQFDLHPEKLVFGKTEVSGLKFFFWDSQFGRFFNTGPIKGSGDISFFLHTTLWAFLPWSILFYAAVANLFKKGVSAKLPKATMIIWASAFFTFLLFSFSKFQLPHYIIIIFPQFAIITAVYLQSLTVKGQKVFSIIQNSIFVIIVLLLAGLAVYFNVDNKYISIAMLFVILALAFVLFKGYFQEKIIARSVFASVALMVFLSVFFYPSVFKYQSGMNAGNWLNKNMPDAKPAVFMHLDAYTFDFYAPTAPLYFNNYDDLERYQHKDSLVIYTPETELKVLQEKYQTVVLKTFEYYRVTRLKPKFLNSKTRAEVLEKFVLVKIN